MSHNHDSSDDSLLYKRAKGLIGVLNNTTAKNDLCERFMVVLCMNMELFLESQGIKYREELEKKRDQTSVNKEKNTINEKIGKKAKPYKKEVKKIIRTRSGYNEFMQENLTLYKNDHPGVDHKTAFRAVAEMWQQKKKIVRPRSEFNQFMHDNLDAYKRDHPGVDHKVAFCAVAGLWGAQNRKKNNKEKNND